MNPACIGEIIDTSLLDARFLEAMRAFHANGPPGPPYYPSSKHIFPHDLRLEVYRFVIERAAEIDPRQRVSLCNETIEMWDELGPVLGMTPEDYVCGCGPTSVPGGGRRE
jgi:hypothetical protein